MLRRYILALTYVAFLWACTDYDEQQEHALPSPENMRKNLAILADDGLRGRYVGTPGIAEAEEYIANQFKAAGLKTLPGEEDFFLDFDVYKSGFDPNSASVQIGLGESFAELNPGVDFRPFAFSDEGVESVELVFAGYGIRAPEYGYDDYKGLDVKGKAVLVLRHEPNEQDVDSPFQGRKHSKHAFFRTKAELARKMGAKAMLLVTDPLHRGSAEDLRLLDTYSLSEDRVDADIVAGLIAVHVSIAAIDNFLAGAGTSLEKLQTAMNEGEQPSDIGVPIGKATITLRRLAETDRVSARNVAGFLPARGKGRDDNWIVVGAHHDHIGSYSGTGDTIFNGADDNASGTTAVIELARLFSQCGKCNERSMVFMTFSSEEVGLLGSKAVFKDEMFANTTISLMLNLDMVGRNANLPVEVEGLIAQPSYRQLLSQIADEQIIALDYASETSPSSDHYPFHAEGIPALFLFTGFHEDYHGLDDESEAIDIDRLGSLVSLSYRFLDQLFDEASENTDQ